MNNTEYYKVLKEETEKLGKLDNSIFLGQQIEAPSYFYGLLSTVNPTKLIEMPVAEELQVGLSIGMAMQGFLPICIIQRMDFLLRASDQIVNHLDKIPKMCHSKTNTKVIILTTIGSTSPLDVGPQHCQDLCPAFTKMLNLSVIKMNTPGQIRVAFDIAQKGNSLILVAEQKLFTVN